MGVNGRNTTINMGGGGAGRGGGNGGGPGSHGGNIPPERPKGPLADLLSETFHMNFNRSAPKNAHADWEYKKAKVENYSKNYNQPVLLCASDPNSGRTYWTSYGKRTDSQSESEKGEVNHKSGAAHIYESHQKNFTDQGVGKKSILSYISDVIERGVLISRKESGNGYEEVRSYNGSTYVLGVGNNNFIVSAYPAKRGRSK